MRPPISKEWQGYKVKLKNVQMLCGDEGVIQW
jgi:hypothetical protein